MVETVPVRSDGDAADDPAIWVHPDDPSASLIIGTDKDGGMSLYDLAGDELQHLGDGRHNNVDVAYGFDIGGELADLVVTSDRDSNTIRIYALEATERELRDLADRNIRLAFEPYGLCLYSDRSSGRLFVIVTAAGDQGGVEQWEITSTGDTLDGRLVRTIPIETSAEGCVVDHDRGVALIAEEDRGIWALSADPDTETELRMVYDNPDPNGDVEGLALWVAEDGSGYLVASDQGNDRFVVLDIESFEHAGSFAIVPGELDGVEHTDGIDATSADLGRPFSAGVFVAQDDRNPPGNQNFKFVPWADIANELDLPAGPGRDPRGTP